MVEQSSTVTIRALGTPEILEMILFCLGSRPSVKDLLRVQLVCSYWRTLIQSSNRLRRLLFLAPDFPRRYKIFEPQDRPRNNLLLRHVLQGRYPTMSMNKEPLQRKQLAPREVTEVGKRPTNTSSSQSGTIDKEDALQWAWNVALSFPAATPPRPAAVSFAESAILAMEATLQNDIPSWTEMYLTQPPCTELFLTRGCQRDVTPILVNPSGITMLQLVKAIHGGEAAWNEGWRGVDGDWHLEGEIRYSCFSQPSFCA